MNFATEQDPALAAATRLTKIVNKLRNSGVQARTRLRRPRLHRDGVALPPVDRSVV